MDHAASQGIQYSDERVQNLSHDAGGKRVGSTADLFPKLVTMQRLCASESFAVLLAQAQTLLSPGTLECPMQSPGSEAALNGLLEEQSGFLLTHLASSPRPLVFAPADFRLGEASPGKIVETGTADGVDLAFPTQLGGMGNGFVVFFGVQAPVNNDLLVDLHRKSMSVMREKLRLAFGGAHEIEKLNEREIECLQLVGNGMKSEAIGEQLNLSVHTVNAYLGSATTKLNAVNRIQAIAKAIRLGLIA